MSGDYERDCVMELKEDEHIEDMYLTFSVADEEYAVSISYVTEIVGLQKMVEVPDVPEYIKGVINLRGKVIPIMDVRLRFGLPEIDYYDRTCIIVLEVDEVFTGLVVDAVSEVVEIAPENITPPPSFRKDAGESVISGMGKRDQKVSIILDVNRLLYADQVSVDAGMETQTELAQAA